MGSRRVADGLLDAVFDAFGPVLPAGVFLVKDGHHHNAERLDGPTAGGVINGSTPSLPMSDDKALQLALHAYAETLRHFVSEVVEQPWPRRGAKTQVSVTDGICIWFGPRSRQQAVLELPAITWTGPVFDSDPSPAEDSDLPPRFAGALTAEQLAEQMRIYEEVREETHAGQQAATSAFIAAKERAPGVNPGQMQAVVHEEFTARGQDLPAGAEEFVAGMLAAPHNPHPTAKSAKVMSKVAIRAMRWVRANSGDSEATDKE
jgi:hypothetical protein